jgi:Flp pilus assembly protein TadB
MEATSGAGAFISLVVLSLLFLAWLVALFALLVDSISIGAKILWFLVLTCLAPVAIPVYMLRHRRHREQPIAERSLA